jgi:carboxymethylenebutenolidase
MCDEDTVKDNEKYLGTAQKLSRRQFSVLTTGAALAALLPRSASAMTTKQSDVSITTADGEADCFFVHPASGKHPGVIIWPDILGLRPAFRLMGERLAESGYAVLVVNPYYRKAKSPVVVEGDSFQDTDVREKIMPLYKSLSTATTKTDADAYVKFLDQQPAVDVQRKIGTTGYCMGGPMTMHTAAAIPTRIGAGASFHGGGLVTDSEDSPHRSIPDMQANFLVCIAENDDEKQPEAKTVLADSFAKVGLPAEIEVYAGAIHGWCPPDSAVYNEAQAERAWDRLLALFDRALG